MSDAKIKSVCVELTPMERAQVFMGAGGFSAPSEVREENERLLEAFRCKDHYVAVEYVQEKKGYYYIHHFSQVNGSFSLAPFHPQKRAMIENGMLIFKFGEDLKNIFVVPIDRFVGEALPNKLAEIFVSPSLMELTRQRLVKDFSLSFPDKYRFLYRLNIRLLTDDGEYSPTVFPYEPLKIDIARPRPQKPWRPPFDQVFGDGGWSNSHGSYHLGIVFHDQESALDVALNAEHEIVTHGDAKSSGGASLGFRQATRPSFGSFIDYRYPSTFSLGHSYHPWKIGSDIQLQPFTTVQHDFRESPQDLVVGVRVGFGTGEKIDSKSEDFNDQRVSMMLADQLTLGLTAYSLVLSAAKENPKNQENREFLSLGAGFFAGQMALNESASVRALQKGKLSAPQALLAPLILPALTWVSSVEKGSDGSAMRGQLFNASAVNLSRDLVQGVTGIDPKNDFWILANAALGLGLGIAYRQSDSDFLRIHLAIASSDFLTYALTYWLDKQFDRF